MPLRSCLCALLRHSRARVPQFRASRSFLQDGLRNLPRFSGSDFLFHRTSHSSSEDDEKLKLKLKLKLLEQYSRKRQPERWKKADSSWRKPDNSWRELEGTQSHTDGVMFRSVVKIFSASTEYSASRPWQTEDEITSNGCGFVIAGKKILTNAHLVDIMYAHTFIYVSKAGCETKFKGKIQKISHECDLAILEVKSDEFWEGLVPLELGDLPSVEEAVTVFPGGGDSNAGGTVSLVKKIGVVTYDHSDANLLAIQIDSNIIPGHSGGPVINRNKLVGLTFQNIERFGVVIPTPIIKHFISEIDESERCSIFSKLGLSSQSMLSAPLRHRFKMGHEMTGVLINQVSSSSLACGILRENDVILSIDGEPIGNDETVPFENKEWVHYSHLVSMKKPGETLLLKVLRNGKRHCFTITLTLVKPHPKVQEYYKPSSYYMFGGFVFIRHTEEHTHILDSFTDCVVISEILRNDANQSYKCFVGVRVHSVNDVDVKNLWHLIELVEGCCSELLVLGLARNKTVVVNYETAKRATSEIMERYNMISSKSKDLLPGA